MGQAWDENGSIDDDPRWQRGPSDDSATQPEVAGDEPLRLSLASPSVRGKPGRVFPLLRRFPFRAHAVQAAHLPELCAAVGL